MARNSEKAMTTLARWHAMKLDEERTKPDRRPYLSTICESLPEAEKWRMQIIREIAKKVSQIQNAGLGEFKLRDLNDEINKCLREKGHWERRIRQLGGSDYAKHGPRMLDNEGKEVPGTRGYKYFGAAKDLPGVRELFEPDSTSVIRRTRGELMRDVDADYYGYRDDDDCILEPLEAEAETSKSTNNSMIVKNYYVNVPSQDDIKASILELKKKKLMDEFVRKQPPAPVT